MGPNLSWFESQFDWASLPPHQPPVTPAVSARDELNVYGAWLDPRERVELCIDNVHVGTFSNGCFTWA